MLLPPHTRESSRVPVAVSVGEREQLNCVLWPSVFSVLCIVSVCKEGGARPKVCSATHWHVRCQAVIESCYLH